MKRILLGVLVYCATSAVTLLVLAGVGIATVGSVSGSVEYLRGARLIPNPPHLDLGRVACDSERDLRFTLNNFKGEAVRIVGIQSSCSCTVANQRPTQIAAKASADIDLHVHFPPAPQAFSQEVLLLTDDQRQPIVRLFVHADVMPQ